MMEDPSGDDPREEDEGTHSPDEVFWSAIAVEGGLAVLALILGALIGPSSRALIPVADVANLTTIFGGVGLGVLATFPILLVIAVVKRVDHPAIRDLEQLGRHPLFDKMLQLSLMELCVISLCAGIGEELLFRGWLLPLLGGDLEVMRIAGNPAATPWYAPGGWLGYWATHPDTSPAAWWSQPGVGNWVLAWLVSSLAFGLAHPITKTYVVVTTLIGVYLGFLVLATGNLLIPITAHALYDAVELALARRERGRETAG